MIHICLATDKNYEIMTMMCMYDIITRRRPDTKITFYILGDRLDQDTPILVFNEIPDVTVIVEFLDSSTIADNIDMNHLYYTRSGITTTTYLRFMIPNLPVFKDLDRVLYIDSDILARKDISDIYNIDLHNKALGMVRDTFYIRFDDPDATLKLHHCGYNAGMILMDLPKLRKLDFASAGLGFSIRQKFNDQATINTLFAQEIYKLDPIYQIPIHNLIQHIPRMGSIDNWNNFHGTDYASIGEIIDQSYLWHFHESKDWQMRINILHSVFQFSLNRLNKYLSTHVVDYVDPLLDYKINMDFKKEINPKDPIHCNY